MSDLYPPPTSFNTVHHRVRVHHCGQPFSLYPFGDIHWDSDLCAHDIFDAACDGMAKQPRSLLLGMGDYLDMVSTSERVILNHASASLHDQTTVTFEKMMRQTVKDFAKKLNWAKGRIIGLLEGNHYYRFSDGSTSTQYLCQLLGCKYLGSFAVVGLSFEYCKKSTKGQLRIIYIVAFHGKGAVGTLGGSINQIVKLAQSVEADIYISGHDHQKIAGDNNRLVPAHIPNSDKLKITHRNLFYVRSGSFMRGYVEGKSSYVAQKGLPPTTLGLPEITLTPTKLSENNDNLRIDIRVTI